MRGGQLRRGQLQGENGDRLTAAADHDGFRDRLCRSAFTVPSPGRGRPEPDPPQATFRWQNSTRTRNTVRRHVDRRSASPAHRVPPLVGNRFQQFCLFPLMGAGEAGGGQLFGPLELALDLLQIAAFHR